MRYIVTGGAGFIGSEIARQLAADNHQVIIVDNLNDLLYSKKIKNHRIKTLNQQYGIVHINLNLATKSLTKILNADDVIIHCAALPGQALSWRYFNEYNQCNVIATKNLLDAAIEKSIRKFIFASTSSVYGSIVTSDKKRPMIPISPYGVTKLAAENLIKCYSQNFSLDYSILRYFSVYGPGQRSDMAIQIFLTKILANQPIKIMGDGSKSRDFTFVKDCAAVTIRASNVELKNLETDVSGSKTYTVNQVVEICFEVTQRRVPVHYLANRIGDQVTTTASQIDNRLGVKETYLKNLRDGIYEQWQYLQENRHILIDD